jgi:hypothetical protein
MFRGILHGDGRVERIETGATTRIAHSDQLEAKVFKHSIEKFVVNHNAESYRFHLNRYMVHVPDAYFCPLDRFVFEPTTNSVIDTDMARESSDPRLVGFGTVMDPGTDASSRRITFEHNGLALNGPMICVSPWGHAFSNQVFHILLGITHCDDVLGAELPIIVPDDLSQREMSNLALIGVGADRLVPVPRATACRVRDAFVPSKSFIRHSTFGPKKGRVNYGFFFEPYDIKAYAARVRANPMVQDGMKDADARVIYLSRKQAGSRFTTNEDEAVAALSPFGARYINPMDTPIHEIASAVAKADVVISAFGAAILHFLAAEPGSTLIEFDHPANDQFGRAICRITECRHVICTSVTDRSRDFGDHSDTTVDIVELVALVASELTRRNVQPKQ